MTFFILQLNKKHLGCFTVLGVIEFWPEWCNSDFHVHLLKGIVKMQILFQQVWGGAKSLHF